MKSERGTVAVLVALALPALMLLGSFVVERGLAEVVRAELQTAVDAAALAGVVELPDALAAVSEAQLYLRENGAPPLSAVVLGPGRVRVVAGPVRVGSHLVVASAEAGVLGMGGGRAVLTE